MKHIIFSSVGMQLRNFLLQIHKLNIKAPDTEKGLRSKFAQKA
jgi:hypothetical protein